MLEFFHFETQSTQRNIHTNKSLIVFAYPSSLNVSKAVSIGRGGRSIQ